MCIVPRVDLPAVSRRLQLPGSSFALCQFREAWSHWPVSSSLNGHGETMFYGSHACDEGCRPALAKFKPQGGPVISAKWTPKGTWPSQAPKQFLCSALKRDCCARRQASFANTLPQLAKNSLGSRLRHWHERDDMAVVSKFNVSRVHVQQCACCIPLAAVHGRTVRFHEGSSSRADQVWRHHSPWAGLHESSASCLVPNG